MEFLVRFPKRNGVFKPVHLPGIPYDSVCSPAEQFHVRIVFPTFSRVIDEGQQKIDPYYQEIISLIFVTVCRFIRPDGPLEPFVVIERVLVDDAEFSIQLTDSTFWRDDQLTGRDIVPGYEVWCLAAGDLQSPRVHVMFPMSSASGTRSDPR